MKPSKPETKLTTCDVHKLVLKDSKPRECTYCSVCSAWICAECEPNIVRRAKALRIRTGQKIAEKFSKLLGKI